jgi:hypothetical protein
MFLRILTVLIVFASLLCENSALAQDKLIKLYDGLPPERLYSQWSEAEKSAELIIYRKGGHGFGMQTQNMPTDHWIDLFYEWLINL